MGCGASSLKSTNEHRDDLAPKPHTQHELTKTSGFTRSNSAGAIPKADDYGANTRSSGYEGEKQSSNDKATSAVKEVRGRGESYDAEAAKQKSKKELLAEAKARRAGGWQEQSPVQIAGIAFS